MSDAPALSEKKKVREVGVELLRVIAMFLIVCQHIMNHGGFLKNAGENTLLLNFINVLFAPTVNIFVLLSGYFNVRSGFRILKTASLWLQVFFYSVVGLLLALVLGISVGENHVFAAFFPVINRSYWFFGAYILLYLASPFLNVMLNNLDKKHFRALVIGIFCIAYIATRFSISATISLNYGYSFLWFMMLYCVGAYLRCYPSRIDKRLLFFIYSLTVAIQMFFKYFLNDTKNFFINLIYTNTDYDQPVTLIASLCVVLLFLGINSNGSPLHKAIGYIGGCTFGVYLFHETALLRKYLYFTICRTSEHWGEPFAALWVLLFAVLIFAIGVAAESIRQGLFYIVRRALSGLLRSKDDPN